MFVKMYVAIATFAKLGFPFWITPLQLRGFGPQKLIDKEDEGTI